MAFRMAFATGMVAVYQALHEASSSTWCTQAPFCSKSNLGPKRTFLGGREPATDPLRRNFLAGQFSGRCGTEPLLRGP